VTDSVLLNRLTDALVDWLPTQRWFAGKARSIRAVRVASCTEVVTGDPKLLHVVVEVDQDGVRPERYQLMVGARAYLPDQLHHWMITVSDGLSVYDGLHDQDLTGRLLELVTEEASVDGLRYGMLPDAKIDPTLRSRAITSEQSNTSLVYGHQYIFKFFRRLQPGVSPDLEIHRALHEVGCEHIATPLGWFETVQEPDEEPTTLGMLSEFLPNTADGWRMATTSVRDLMAEGDLHAHEVGGDFAAEARRLGNAVATVHTDLDAALGHTFAGARELAAEVEAMHARLDSVLPIAPELAEHEPALRAAFDAARGTELPVRLQRIHGDLHLGQALRTPLHWVLIDFEGEPLRPMVDRLAPSSPLRDVAGMLRSFDYAAHQMLVGQDRHSERQQAFRALEWADRNRTAFLEGYAEVSTSDPGGQPNPPAAARTGGDGAYLERDAALLHAFELDKAVYEVGYEVNNRPDWLPIPLTSIAHLTTEPE
jgi:maltokinase